MKKYNLRSKWAKIRSLNFKIGLTLSLAFVFFAFQIDIADQPRSIPDEPIPEWTTLENSTPNHITKVYIPPVKPKVQEHRKKILDLFKIETVEEQEEDDDSLFEVEDEEDRVDFSPINTTETAPAAKVEPAYESEDIDEIVDFARHMPRFGDCDETLTETEKRACSDKQLLNYIYRNINYPSQARALGMEGRVIAQFVIDKKGKITDINVIRDNVGAGAKEEVIRLLEKMPNWIPGKQNYRPVNVRITLPITFTLQ